MKTAPLLLISLVASSAFAKPLYITVPRTYGTHESPVVDLAFSGTEPVELRVLKPDNVPDFITKQFNIRRAYEPPVITSNPGRALSRGLNSVRSPGDRLLLSLDVALRKKLGSSLPEREKPEIVSELREGAEVLVGLPKGMSLVHTEYLNLDLGGDVRAFNVPGFTLPSEMENSGYQDRRLSLSPLPAGVYVLQLVQGKIEGQVVLVVTDLVAQVKQSDSEVLVRVANRGAAPQAGAAVTVYRPNGTKVSGTTNTAGEARLEVNEPRLVATVQVGSDVVMVDTDFYSTLGVTPDVFIYTDRPIYRPGDVVRYRGVLRQPDGFLSRLFRPKSLQVKIALIPDLGPTVTTKAAIGEFGTFSGQSVLPKDLGTMVVRVEASIDERGHQAETRVQEYVKPTFFLEVSSTEETVTPGQPIKVKVRARRYAGGAPKNAAYEVFLYRSQLDAPAWTDDSGRGGKGSAVTYGSASTTEGQLSLPQRLYSSVQERGESGDSWSSAPKFDAQGEAEIEVPVPALAPGDELLPWRYSLSIRARDDQGTFANGAQSFFLSQTDMLATVKAAQKLARPDSPATFAVRATTLSGKPYGVVNAHVTVVVRKADGSSTSVLEKDLTSDETGVVRFEAKAPHAGVLEATATIHPKKGTDWSGSDTTIVMGKDGEAVMRVPSMVLESAQQIVEPGETIELVGLLPENWGLSETNKGSLWVTLTGSELFTTQKLMVDGTSFSHSFTVEKRFGSAVYAAITYPTPSGRWEERTVPFRIVPRERVLIVNAVPVRAEAAPLTEQTVTLRVTDAWGNGVPAEVSVGVVDKAIYALQSEFRPGVLDFFYPLGRNNVSTFSSADFQGLGYGDALARALRGLPHQRFAAVKPPQKPQREQDTAYWNPAVMTDRDGRATVTFKLPSNQTLWTVTTVAVDATGRFGESTSEFATRGTLNLAANLPQFLRVGDEAEGSVRVSLGTKAKEAGSLNLAVGLTGAIAGNDVKQTVGLKPQDEQLVPVSLKATGEGVATVALNGSGIGDPVRDSRSFDVVPAMIDEKVVAVRQGGGDLSFDIPAGSTVMTSRVTVIPSVTGAALTNIRELLTYPYGCVEQLVSTTVPNVAVYRTMEKADALGQLDTEGQQLMTEARSRAVQGSQRILQAAVQGSGFAWYAGYGTPSIPMTLIALDGLSWSIEAGLVGRDDVRITDAAAWLEQADLPFTLAAQRSYVLARLQGKKQAANVRNLIAGNAGTDVLGLSYAALAAQHAGIIDEPEMQTRLKELSTQARTAFTSAVAWNGDDSSWQLPLRRAGYAAILGHAGALTDGTDEKLARKRTLELLSENTLSTYDRGVVLLHSQWLMERELKTFKLGTPPKLDAKGAQLLPASGAFAASLPADLRSMKIDEVDGVVSWKVTYRTPLAQVQPTANGLALDRKYYVLRNNQRAELGVNDKVSQGEEVYVELNLDAHAADRHQWWHRSAYTVLEDAVPAGFVVLQEDKAFRSAPYSLPLTHESVRRRTMSPQRVTWFLEEPAYWSDSPRTLGYVMRAQFAGTFAVPPAKLEDMYASDVFARTGATSISIAASGAAR